MTIKIGAFGYGVGAILAAGAVLLAVLGNNSWKTFLIVALIIWFLSILIRKI